MLLSNLILALKMYNVNKTSQSGDTTVEIISTKPVTIKILVLCYCVFILASLLGTLIFIAVSWYKVTPWRQFKNYIFLNVIATLALLDISKIMYLIVLPSPYKHIIDLMYRLSMASFSNWQLIMCMEIYTKIVKVFSGNLQHKYLKANIFAWGLAFIESMIATYVICPSFIYTMPLMTYVILGLYLSIIYALVKLTLVRMVSQDNSFQIIRIFVYVTSAFAILILLQLIEYFNDLSETMFVAVLGLQLIFIGAFLSMKAHREQWDEHLKRSNRDVLYIMT